MSINIGPPSVDELKPKIAVIGVGGAGGNAIANMIAANVEGVDFVVANTDAQALEAFTWLTRSEGIIPALESAHALAALPQTAKGLEPEDILLVNLSGRGDKDLDHVIGALEAALQPGSGQTES